MMTRRSSWWLGHSPVIAYTAGSRHTSMVRGAVANVQQGEPGDEQRRAVQRAAR
jgi:hypothetical protein